ncbi:MAG: HAD-IC family P-type ATPase [Pseudomonadales bacterium]|nr:HAD-IC family P-type ATPase [Pseudomonadales bacterium]
MNECSNPHGMTQEAVFSCLATSEEGLSSAMVLQIQARKGKNTLPLAPPKPAWQRFFLQFHNVLIYILLISATISALLQHYLDCGVILAVVLVNAIVGFIQEGKAEDALRAIMTMTASQCTVIRDGTKLRLDSVELVPGDIVLLEAGDRVPADIRLFFTKDLRCDESTLTGEAQPVGKHTETVDDNTLLAERQNMAYMGTMVTYGLARGVVTHTALETQIGKISELVRKVELEQTPLQHQLARFARQLTVAIIAVSLLTVVLGVYWHDYAAGDMFQAAVGIAVSAIPEGLPAIVTIALAIGVRRMAVNRALVRRLPAVEVLGSVDVICSDKTGTLTANAMTAREVYTVETVHRVSGEGYRPEGTIEPGSSSEAGTGKPFGSFDHCCIISMLCNEATIEEKDGQWFVHGDPTEGALLVLAMKQGLLRQSLNEVWPRIDVLPFDSEKRYMATLHENRCEGRVLMVKGAPERLLAHATHQWGANGLEPVQKEAWVKATDELAVKGMRVMALARKSLRETSQALDHAVIESDLVMVGLVGITDPPRAEAIESIRQCHRAGIRVKMITGDNPVTAAAIGKELNLDVSRVLTGAEIDNLDDRQLAMAVEDTDIFARTSPANKLQLVNALQLNRHVVAMTGDGVNDAPALKKANIGVAMGQKGTDAAKEASDFVLTDDNFSTIAKAVCEGRTVYDNIVKSIVFILPTSLAESLVIMTAILCGFMMPITPAQILWINMVTTVTLALVLGFEGPEKNVMCRPPRIADKGLFSPLLFARMLMVGGMGAAIVFTLFHYYRNEGFSVEYSRTIAINTLVMIEIFYLFNCRFLTQTVFTRHFMLGFLPMLAAVLLVLVLQMVFTYMPLFQQLFGIKGVSLHDWLVIVISAMPVLLVVELEKGLQRLMSQAGDG